MQAKLNQLGPEFTGHWVQGYSWVYSIWHYESSSNHAARQSFIWN